jgi:UDP-N-acetyl-D-mannosaminuronic acid transferase (WecB/TagA/CpsF family)
MSGMYKYKKLIVQFTQQKTESWCCILSVAVFLYGNNPQNNEQTQQQLKQQLLWQNLHISSNSNNQKITKQTGTAIAAVEQCLIQFIFFKINICLIFCFV